MTKLLLWLAKAIVLGFWFGAIYFSFIHPLPGKISTLIPVSYTHLTLPTIA